VARFIRNPREPDEAEVAVTVVDSWQRRGLGTTLLREMVQRAAEEGIRHFTAEILAENRPMLTLAHWLGHAETTYHGSTVSARIDLPAATEQPGALSHDAHDLPRAARGVHRPARPPAEMDGALGEDHRDPAGAGWCLQRHLRTGRRGPGGRPPCGETIVRPG
jgi:Acetyltransferase (GNAT) family